VAGRERVLGAFDPGGARSIGAVVSYDSILIRDHWFELTEADWWRKGFGEPEQELAWMGDVLEESGLDWIRISPSVSRTARERQRFERRSDGLYRIDPVEGREEFIVPPVPGGGNTRIGRDVKFDLQALPRSRADVDVLVSLEKPFDRGAFLAEGGHDTAEAARKGLDVALYGAVHSPLYELYNYLGYEGMMILIAEAPALAGYMAERILCNAKGSIERMAAMEVDAVWIEECFTDQISPAAFRGLNLPGVKELAEHVRKSGLLSVYYYCGDPCDRMDLILEIGADALHFEESKKGFRIDISEVAARVDGCCVLFGNLDSVGILQDASAACLEQEVKRQLAAGRRNGGRFVMSTGSPVTPQTPVERVRLYTDLVHNLEG